VRLREPPLDELVLVDLEPDRLLLALLGQLDLAVRRLQDVVGELQ